jgi:hypothetical protein
MTALLVIHAIGWTAAAAFFALVACFALDPLPPERPSAARYILHIGAVLFCVVMAVWSLAVI